MLNSEWYKFVHSRIYEVPSLGCQSVLGATVFGEGHVLREGALLTEGNATSTVAETWAQAAYLKVPERTRRTIGKRCLVLMGPGHRIYGHWIIDFLPRLMVAKLALKDAFKDVTLLWPSDTPDWARKLIEVFFGEVPQLLIYDPLAEVLDVESLWVPTHGYSCDYHLHRAIGSLYGPIQAKTLGTRRLCISRAKVEGRTAGVVKHFHQRVLFEQRAVAHGYELIYPETLSIRDQIALVHSCCALVGEYGSGLHSSVFAAEDIVLGAVGCFNTVQSRLCQFSRQRTAYLIPEETKMDGASIEYSCREQDIDAFFEAIEANISSGG